MSFFSTIQGLKSEDLSSELLAYILDPKSGNRTDRLVFFKYILKLDRFNIDEYQISTQSFYGKIGRPDIEIIDNNNILLIENKLTADFTEDQIKRYFEILENDVSQRDKYLCFLCPLKYQNEYLDKICRQLEVSSIDKTGWNKIKTVSFLPITWQDICENLNSNTFISKNLIEYMEETVLKTEKIKEEDMEYINSDRIPEIMNTIWNTIANSRTYFDERNIAVSRMSQSKTQYLYYLQYDWGDICVQTFMDFWRKYKTPFALQVIEKQNKNYDRLTEIGYIHDEEYHYVYPIRVESTEIENEFCSKAFEIASKTNELMKSIQHSR